MRREVNYHDAGIKFTITCPTCPLLEHFKALDKTPEPCLYGIQTNMQGPVPIGSCKFWGGNDSLKNEPENKLSAECTFKAAEE